MGSFLKIGTAPTYVAADSSVGHSTVSVTVQAGTVRYGDFATVSAGGGTSLAAGSSVPLTQGSWFAGVDGLLLVEESPVVVDSGRPAGLMAVAPGWLPVVDHAHPPNQTGNLSPGTTPIVGMYRLRHMVLGGSFGPVTLAFCNWYCNGTAGETVGPNDVTVRAGVELGNGKIMPLYFNGARDVLIKPGGTVWSDPTVLDHRGPADTYDSIYSRTNVAVASAGMKWPYTTIFDNAARAGDGGEEGTGVNDKTTSGTISIGANYGYGPIAIAAANTSKRRFVGVIGDSIVSGGGDATTALGGFQSHGYVARALLTAGIPYTRVSAGGDRVVAWVDRTLSHRRRAHVYGASYLICGYGINDVAGASRTLAQVQADLLTTWTEQANAGARVYQPTLTPYTTSTDAWATVVNQTANANDAVRINLNNWLRAGAPIDPATKAAVAVGTAGALLASGVGHPLTAYFEIADVVESARDSGKWVAAGTTDGIHPKTAQHILMAAAVPVSQFV